MKKLMIKFLPIIILLVVPLISLAQAIAYEPLVGLPGVRDSSTGEANFNDFINTLYYMSIGVAALLAVIKIVIAGIKYMLTDIVPAKGEAKKDIQGALIGLLVVMGAVLILTVINPKLVNISFNPVKVAEPVYTPPTDTGRPGPAGTMSGQDIPIEIPADVINTSPAPEGLNDLEKAQWICENQRLEPQYCPLGSEEYQSGATLPSQSEAYCYNGEWDAYEEICVVRGDDIKNFEGSGGTLGGHSTLADDIGNDVRPEIVGSTTIDTTDIGQRPFVIDYTGVDNGSGTDGTGGICGYGFEVVYDPAELIDPATNTYGPTPPPRCVPTSGSGGGVTGGGGFNTSCGAAACCPAGTFPSVLSAGGAICVDSSGNNVGTAETTNNPGTAGGGGSSNPCPAGQILDPALGGLTLGGASCVPDPKISQEEINGSLFCKALGFSGWSNGKCI